MPPRKSDVSKVVEGDEGTPAKEGPVKDGINIEDLNLPKSIVTRLAKGVLPANTQIQSNAMLAMSKGATVFVNYLASTANENAASSGRKTISPQDVLKALDDLEFGDFKPRLEAELAKFNENQTDKRNAYRKKVAVADKTPSKPAEGEEAEGEDGEKEGKGGEPKAKRARRDHSDGVPSGEDTLGHEQDQEPDEGDVEGDEEEAQDESEEEEEGEEEVDPELETEEQMDEEQREVEDEAMDNGDDSD